MQKKTALLEYVLAETAKLVEQDGRKMQNSNYFLAALYGTVAAYAAGEEIPALASEEARAELEAAKAILAAYGEDYSAKKEALLAFMHAEGYSYMTDDLHFAMIPYKAEGHARKAKKESVDVPAFLTVILEDSDVSDAIRTVVLKTEVKPRQRTKMDEDLSEVIKRRRSGGKRPAGETDETEETEGEQQPPQSEPPRDGKQSLAESVASARRVRDTLLSRVFGQDAAVASFVSGYFQAELMAHTRTGMSRPAATFLFAGPPGVGKTFLAECAAEALALPYMRFDMSEYADHQSINMLVGSDQVWKDSKPGALTSFVEKNPRCILLFDEIEKAHLNIVHLFLQILDAGRLRDAHTEKEVFFSQAVIIFTTNVGRSLYEDPNVTNLSSLPKKTVLKALAVDKNPTTGESLFPSAICSRFAAGNVVMFNHLSARDLFTIAKRELACNVDGFATSTGIKLSISDDVATAILFAEGGYADARAVKGRANAFFHEELYELFRLIADDEKAAHGGSLQDIDVDIFLDGAPDEVAAMFKSRGPSEILVFAEEAVGNSVVSRLPEGIVVHVVDNEEAAKKVLFAHDISIVLCDVRVGMRGGRTDLLNLEDVASAGRDFLSYVLASSEIPTYLLTEKTGDVNTEEFLSFARIGVREVLSYGEAEFAERAEDACRIAYAQENMQRLAKANKVLTYKTAQTISEDRASARIYLFDFRLSISRDTTDEGNILDGAGRPSVRFSDVIGAEDAKTELAYFIDYLKNPVAYLRRGLHAPKGVLLYGPPGTGKTMLARAMAGESDVTFLTTEGNQFLKKYVGEGPEAVHALFRTARKYAPAILFVDEIDAIGKTREGADADHSSDILTAFLTEMDGFNTDTTRPVFVLAATNYALDGEGRRSLDPALVRRFDRRIFVDLPNKAERKTYLLTLKEKHPTVQLSEDVLESIAMRGVGMSLADLSQIFEMALRSAIRTGGEVTDATLDEAFETYTCGEAKKFSEEYLISVARHEAGHALLCYASGETPAYVTVVARGDHGGYMQYESKEEKGSYTKAELCARIRTALGGRAAELVYYGAEDGLSTGASGDLMSATHTAERILCEFGMDEDFGLAVSVGDDRETLYPEIRTRVNEILAKEMKAAYELVASNRAAIDALVTALLEKNHLRAEETREIFAKYAKL